MHVTLDDTMFSNNLSQQKGKNNLQGRYSRRGSPNHDKGSGQATKLPELFGNIGGYQKSIGKDLNVGYNEVQ